LLVRDVPGISAVAGLSSVATPLLLLAFLLMLIVRDVPGILVLLASLLLLTPLVMPESEVACP
jgi:hypothetical protein